MRSSSRCRRFRQGRWSERRDRARQFGVCVSNHGAIDAKALGNITTGMTLTRDAVFRGEVSWTIEGEGGRTGGHMVSGIEGARALDCLPAEPPIIATNT